MGHESAVEINSLLLDTSLNASRPSDHPPVRGENVTTFRWDHRLEDKTSSWHLNGFPDGSNIESTVQYRGETHRYAIHLHLLPCRDTKQIKDKRHDGPE